MTSNDLQNLLNSTAVLGAFLLAGLFLRAKIPFFRRLLVPASVLGGVVGLLLGPQILGRSGIMLYDDEWVNIWSLLPSILMTPIFASLPLCNFKEKGEKKKLDKRHACTVFMEAGLGGACFAIQMLLGVGLALLISLADSSLYPYTNFGCEMPFGFNGGHALAGLLGGTSDGKRQGLLDGRPERGLHLLHHWPFRRADLRHFPHQPRHTAGRDNGCQAVGSA